MAEKIAALFVKHVSHPGKYCDGGNLYLQVRKSTRKIPSGVTKSWLFRYSRFGKETWMGLGPYPDVSLSEARNLATRERKKILQDIDPLTDKRARKIAARLAHDKMLSFAECAELYVDSQAPGWSNPKHIGQWRSTLKNVAGPIIGHLPVDQIDTALVMRCIEPIWTTKTETASRLRGRIEAVLDWCAESTNYAADVAEMALAHTVRDKTEAAYRRGDLFEKRARLMADWTRYCSKPAVPAAVVAIRQGTG